MKTEGKQMFGKLSYPQTKKDDVVDDYFGVKVPDPYRWLEDADSPETEAWTKEQEDFTTEHLSRLPMREHFQQRLSEIWNFTRYTPPVRRDDRLFFTKHDGLSNQPVLYVQDGDEPARVLLDPNDFSEDGTTALMGFIPSKDGTLLLYALAPNASDWREFRVRNVETGQDLPDLIDNIRLSGFAWRPGNKGFYYTRLSEAEDSDADNQARFPQLMYHEIGTEQAADVVMFRYNDYPSAIIWPRTSNGGDYIILTIIRAPATATRIFTAKVADTLEFEPLLNDADAEYYVIGNDGDTFYIQTTNDAPHYRVIAVERDNPTPENWREVVPNAVDTISNAAFIGGHLVIDYLRDATHIVKIYKTDGTFVRELEMPGVGSIGMMTGNYDGDDMFLDFYSYLKAPSVLRYDFGAVTPQPFFEEPEIGTFNADDYETKQVFFTSKDGTRIPMFITARKGLELNGENPTILYGYGGFNVSVTPQYYPWLPAWLERGGVHAVVTLRGGSEYGDEWHKAGMFEKKQNVFDDFIGAAEYLIAEGYTSTEKLAIEGRSNGGLLVAATMLQRPDLFGAVLCHVPVIDMLRYQHHTAGRYWTTEYGDANDSKEDFSYLYEYSPLHNVRDGQAYPPILITTAAQDDRVVPMHSKKFAAALQAADPGNNIIFLRIDRNAGHGAGKSTAKLIEERADVLAFAATLLGEPE